MLRRWAGNDQNQLEINREHGAWEINALVTRGTEGGARRGKNIRRSLDALTGISNAEVDMHFSMKDDLIPVTEFWHTLKVEKHTKIAGLLIGGKW